MYKIKLVVRKDAILKQDNSPDGDFILLIKPLKAYLAIDLLVDYYFSESMKTTGEAPSVRNAVEAIRSGLTSWRKEHDDEAQNNKIPDEWVKVKFELVRNHIRFYSGYEDLYNGGM